MFVYVDNRPLSDPSQCPNFWGLFCPWLLARCRYLGPFQEVTTAIHVPIDASSGLDKVHFTWAGTFVLEALVYLFPDKHIVLIDTDCVPTSLFEVEELVRMTQIHREQATGVEPNTIRFFFSCVCLMASMARSVNCLGQKNAVQVHLIGAKPIVQVKT